jgi:hypothetical protein
MYTNEPYYHMGLRINKAFSDQFTAGFQLVNGWNNVEDNNSGKTMGFTTAWTTKNKKVFSIASLSRLEAASSAWFSLEPLPERCYL